MRMDTDIRIPMTADQKKLLLQAIEQEPEGMAAWARSVLLREAERRIRANTERVGTR